MKAPDFPPDETQRLEALRTLAILDTEPEERLDRITKIAQHLFDVPIALISLIDTDRQWFKSCQGLGARETPRNISFCGHAILSDQIFYIPDATRDERFADNPLVTGPPDIRFYAGSPLVSPEGYRIGTLCIIDNKPHELDQEQLDDLRQLGNLAQEEIFSVRRSEAMRLIRTQEATLHAILGGITDAILTIDEQGLIHSWNRGTETLFRCSTPDLREKSIQTLLPDLDIRILKTSGDTTTTTEPSALLVQQEFTARRTDGSLFPNETTISRLSSPGRPQFIVSIRDITQRMEMEKIKREFVSIVSHELRTPLTSIRGAIGLITGGAVGDFPPQARDMLQIAQHNCDRLVHMINDILDTEKLSQGKLQLNMQPTALAPVVQHAIDLNQGYAASLGTRIDLHIADDTLIANIDEHRLIQVMSNLLSNAAKHTPAESRIQVRLYRAGEQAILEVRDEGPGIAHDQQELIFEKFRQLEHPDTRSRQGTGLGLSIARGIMEALDGTISVQSSPGKGATFSLRLPLHHG